MTDEDRLAATLLMLLVWLAVGVVLLKVGW